jgi:hypothetical protein
MIFTAKSYTRPHYISFNCNLQDFFPEVLRVQVYPEGLQSSVNVNNLWQTFHSENEVALRWVYVFHHDKVIQNKDVFYKLDVFTSSPVTILVTDREIFLSICNK